MKILIITHKPCNSFEGQVYSTGGFVKVISSLGEIFDEVTILSPKDENINYINGDSLKGGNFKHDPISSNYLKMGRDVMLKIKKYKDEYDFLQLRMPSMPSTLSLLSLSSSDIKTFIYLGGDFTKTIHYKYRKSKFKKLYILGAAIFERISLIGIKKYPTFVTGNELFEKYSKYTTNLYMVRSTSLTRDEIETPKILEKRKKLVICLVGRLSEEKGIKFFLEEVYPLLEKKYSISIRVLGEGPLENYVKSYKGNIDYYGIVSNRTKLLNILRESDFLVLNSITEGTPKVLLEAMSQGTPVIATNVGGIPNIISNYENGLLYEALNKYEFLQKFNELINPDLYNYISAKGIEYSKNHTLERLNQQFLSKI